MDEHVKKYQNFGISDLHWKCISYAAAKLCQLLTKKRSPTTEWVCGRDGLVIEEHTYIRTNNRS